MIKSALYKLFHDVTFKITLIIGIAMAVLMNLIYVGIDLIGGEIGITCNGQSMFISSLSPTENFGLTVPINLIVFTIGEFSFGTIRNKIIAGHRKTSIYLSLVLIGFIFTVSLMAIYFALSVGIASIIGGFDVNGSTMLGGFDPKLLYQYPIMALATYVFITCFAIFMATLTRNIGGAMPLVLVPIVILSVFAMVPVIQNLTNIEAEFNIGIQGWVNPVFTFGAISIQHMAMTNTWFIASIVTPLYWAIIFTALGILIFNKRDIK